MTNKTISALSSASTIVGTEVLPIVQSSATVKVSVANLTSGLGTIIATKGGTGQTSYAVGDLLYADTTTTLAKLGIGAANYVLTSSGTVPQYVAQSTLSVGSATNATNTAITDDTTTATTVYPTWVTTTTGNLPQKTASTKLSFVPSTGVLSATSFTGAGTGLTGTASSLSIGGNAANVTGTVAIANGGSGQTTAQLAINAFAGAVTSGSYLRGNGTNVVMSTIQAADVPTLNQNTTGTASNVTGTVVVANGGTGVTTLTGVAYGNGTSAFTAATGSQIATAIGSTAVTNATNATNVGTTDNTSSSSTYYPTLVSATSGNNPITTSSTKLSFVPSTGKLTATSYGGAWAGSTIGTTYGGTGLTSFTANGVVYASSTSALATSSAFTFNGTDVGFTGNLVPGTAAKGINFTANTPASGMTSQLLNWYEEGTFTFGFTPSTSGTITLNGSYTTGYYTRVGRQVTVTGEGFVSSVSSPVGVLRITGLPFTTARYGAFSVYCEGLGAATSTMFEGKIPLGTTYLEVYYPQLSNPAGAATYIVANSIVSFTATYFV